MRRLSPAIVLLMMVPAMRAPASEGSDAHGLLRRGVSLAREASFAASVAALEQARARGPLSPPELADCSYWLATDYVAMGSTQAARRELHALVVAAPGYELPPFTSPKVAALYRDAREELDRAPRLRALPPKTEGGGRQLVLRFEPSRTGGTTYGAAYWRWHGDREFVEAPLGHAGEDLQARLPLEHGGTLEYYAETRSPNGAALAGSREHPLELPVAEPLQVAAHK